MNTNPRRCFDFIQRGHCHYGSHCRYSHVQPGSEAASTPSIGPNWFETPARTSPQHASATSSPANRTFSGTSTAKATYSTPTDDNTTDVAVPDGVLTTSATAASTTGSHTSTQDVHALLLYFVSYLESNYSEVTRPKTGRDLKDAITRFKPLYAAALGHRAVSFAPAKMIYYLQNPQSIQFLAKCQSYVECYDGQLQQLKYRSTFLTAPAEYRLGASADPARAATQTVASAARQAVGTSSFLCQACGVNSQHQQAFDEHCASKRHKLMVAAQNLKQYQAELTRDKCGVEVQMLDHVTVTVSERKVVTAQITNRSRYDRTLTQYGLVRPRRDFAVAHLPKPLLIPSGSAYKINVGEAVGFDIGEIRCLVVFNFGDFKIGRYFVLDVAGAAGEAAEDFVAMQPKEQYRRPNYARRVVQPAAVVQADMEAMAQVERGEPPPRIDAQSFQIKLEQYPVPGPLRVLLHSADMSKLLTTLSKPLSIDTYLEVMSALLHVEEVQMETDIKRYDAQTSLQSQGGHLLWLNVPGLAEKRPSVLYGDRVFVSISPFDTVGTVPSGRKPSSRICEGYVHRVEQNRVGLKFSRNFHDKFVEKATYHVRFSFSRTPMRRCHQAVFMAGRGRSTIAEESKSGFNRATFERLLFPQEQKLPASTIAASIANPSLPWFEKKLNDQQKRAVDVIVRLPPLDGAPYIIMGPPGTGKTTVVVEAIKQVVHRDRSAKLLICAPSNSAADVIVERLSNLDSVDMLRVNAYKRARESIPREVAKYSHYNDRQGIYDLPSMNKLRSYRVIVCTCISAGLLYSSGIGANHFTHVFIDESGHATEPECLVALAGLVSDKTRVVLAGDPQQLGPVIRSPVAIKFRFDRSILERLMALEAYSRNARYADWGHYNPLLVTKLLHNYRSHPAILKQPNDFFYFGELVASAEKAARESLCTWDQLPNRNNFPVIFHGVEGKEQREGNSPSWFNPFEALLVQQYIVRLMAFRSGGVSLDQIGVITPYRKQVEKIRTLLRGKGMEAVKVGSVEEFQGQERRIVIISCVRSSDQYLDFDATYNLGFLKNARRFNVAITRAKALVVVIGNPHVLATDPHWGSFLQYCNRNKAYTGCPLPTDLGDEKEAVTPGSDELANEDQELLRSMETLKLTDEKDYLYDEELEDAQLRAQSDAINPALAQAGAHAPMAVSRKAVMEDPEWSVEQ